MSEILVRAESLARIFEDGSTSVTAVAEATFDLAAADAVAMMGPSGSGKSTLLHLVAGLDEPTGGAITWPGVGPREALRPGPIAFAFQGPSLLPPLTVSENVVLPLLLVGTDESTAHQRATAMLRRLHVDDVADKLPEELSGGQTQRAGLARALVARPKLLLADEPTGQLDRETAVATMDVLLQETRAIGATLVVATHDALVAARLGTIWSMQDGRLRTEVSPSLA